MVAGGEGGVGGGEAGGERGKGRGEGGEGGELDDGLDGRREEGDVSGSGGGRRPGQLQVGAYSRHFIMLPI